jgi:predicted ATP-dependent endonuclease of OLD family
VRKSTAGVSDLGFQIVPGLAELSSKAIAPLDAEAGRVAYLIDGDNGGKEIHAHLKAANIDDARIAIVGGDFTKNLTPEDLVSPTIYLAAVNEELHRSHGQQLQMTEADIVEQSRPGALHAWCESHGIKAPNRVAIASRIIERTSDSNLLDEAHLQSVRELHQRIEHALKGRSA